MRGSKARLSRDESGVALVDYALIAALIVLAIVAGLAQVSGTTGQMWNHAEQPYRST
ncbi:MAG: Flp family type IVb pilin [Pseudomonadota bacterium]|nr:Flp family type IVb pilin [Pseudomonadota bacterium]